MPDQRGFAKFDGAVDDAAGNSVGGDAFAGGKITDEPGDRLIAAVQHKFHLHGGAGVGGVWLKRAAQGDGGNGGGERG